jgi:hypothetical protein
MKSFKIPKNFSFILILFSMGCLLSCTSPEDLYSGGGIGGTGVISTGTVTAIGSVWVNDIEFDTRQADIYVNDEYVGAGDNAVVLSIHPGQVIRVEGNLNGDGSGRADTVYYLPTVSGPIQEAAEVGEYDRMFTLLGQEVIANEQTNIQGAILDELETGNFVDVSGYIDDTGKIHASFIVKKADGTNPGDVFSLSGAIHGLDEKQKVFFINALRVQYENADLVGYLLDGMENGLWVHVVGRWESGEEVLMAETLDPFDRLEEDQGKKVQIEGITGTDLWQNRFRLEGYFVEVNSQTLFSGGNQDEILSGSRIEVEGSFSGEILVADQIKFISDYKVESEILAINSENKSIILYGFEGVTIKTNDLTRFKGQARSFEELDIADHLIVRGRFVEEDTLLATQIIKKSSP